MGRRDFYDVELGRYNAENEDSNSSESNLELAETEVTTSPRVKIVRIRTPRKEGFFLRKLKSLKFVLPPQYREEFEGDIHQMFNEMLDKGHSKLWVYIVMSARVTSVFYAGFLIKFREMFSNKQKIDDGEQ